MTLQHEGTGYLQVTQGLKGPHRVKQRHSRSRDMIGYLLTLAKHAAA